MNGVELRLEKAKRQLVQIADTCRITLNELKAAGETLSSVSSSNASQQTDCDAGSVTCSESSDSMEEVLDLGIGHCSVEVVPKVEVNIARNPFKESGIDELQHHHGYFTRKEASGILCQVMAIFRYAENFIGCIYLDVPIKQFPCYRYLERGTLHEVKLSRLAIMAYHPSEDIIALFNGKEVSYLCRNVTCFNPYHLEVETPEEIDSRKSCPTTFRKVIIRKPEGDYCHEIEHLYDIVKI